MNYKSPINFFKFKPITDIVKDEIDNDIYKAVIGVGVSVDKGELKRALTYDRNQYEKGFHDGLKVNSENIFGRPKSHWHKIEGEHYDTYVCYRCGKKLHSTSRHEYFNFCPRCGARMIEEDNE